MTVTLNVDRLATAIRYIDGNPARWHQGSWGAAFLPLSAALEIDPDPYYTDSDTVPGIEPRVFLDSNGMDSTPMCQTAFCVAGWVTHQAQYVDKLPIQERWNEPRTVLYDVEIHGKSLLPGDASTALLVDLGGADNRYDLPDTTEYSLAGNATRILEKMYNGENTRLDIQRFAENFAGLAGQTWPVPLPEWADDRTYWTWVQDDAGVWYYAD